MSCNVHCAHGDVEKLISPHRESKMEMDQNDEAEQRKTIKINYIICQKYKVIDFLFLLFFLVVVYR